MYILKIRTPNSEASDFLDRGFGMTPMSQV